jgi:hypothetical protein
MDQSRERKQQRREKDLAYAEVLRAMIKNENDYTNHRTTWLLVAEGLLVNAVANVAKDNPLGAIALAVIGILAAMSYGHALQNSMDSRQYLKRLWKKRIAARGYDIEDVLPVHGGYPGNKAISWLLPDKFVPRVAICAWAIFIVYIYIKRCT